MGNHSDTGELLEEARAIPITEMSVSYVDSLVDEYGNTIELGNPTRLKGSGDREIINLMRNEIPGGLEVIEDKPKKKKTS